MATPQTNLTDPLVEGWFDGVCDDRISGWAWHPHQPGREAVVELIAGGRVVAAASASLRRADLGAAGKREGVCAFEIQIDQRFPIGVPISARVVLDDTVCALPGDAIVLDSLPPVRPPPSPAPTAANCINATLNYLDEIVGHLDEFGPESLRGWIWHKELQKGPVSVCVYDGDREVLEFIADAWRADLAEFRQGDGRCGFSLPLPLSLRDGESHVIDLRLANTPHSLLREPLQVRFARATSERPMATTPQIVHRDRNAPGKILISLIVVFYNMQREAQRTLTSLTRSYQRDVEDLEYEVICVDNGSDPPLDPTWIESFGPQFTLVRPAQPLPSPCQAINEAARRATGRYLAILIDGAHVLTPGILREAADAFRADPDAVVALRRWFVGGDQRWLSSVGYTRAMEDILFSRVDWQHDGYKLFRIGMPIGESPNDWFDGLIESNCLILPHALYDRLGGIDEAFDEAGGGFANLDLFRRAVLASEQPVICLMGEATFHQFHGGTTSNVTDEEKERRVRVYARHYRELRGQEFEGISAERIRYRGSLRYPDCMTISRQRPLFATQLGITDEIRPGFLPQHFDHGARLNVQSAFVESALYSGTQWAGTPVRMAPADLINIQMLAQQLRPNCIVTTSPDDGLIAFLDSIMPLLGLDATRIIRVLPEIPAKLPPARVQPIVGDPCHPDTMGRIRRAIGGEENVLVLFAPQSGDYLPVDSIRAYASLVSYDSYLVFLGTVFGQPWLAYSKNWYLAAIRQFVATAGDFVLDTSRDRGILSVCISGYLKRVCEFNLVWKYDPSLDYIDLQETKR